MAGTAHSHHTYRILAIGIVLIAAVIGLIFFFSNPSAKHADYKRIRSESYNTVFLSMFPTDNYDEESFAYWRGQQTLKTGYNLPDLKSIQAYMKQIAKSGNEISYIYLGVNPEKVSSDELLALLRNYPSVQFQLILPYPSMDYWKTLSEEEVTAALEAFRTLADTMEAEENIHVYLFDREWLLCNPANYENTLLTTAEASLTLMLNCDTDHRYVLNAENVDAAFEQFSALLAKERNTPTVYPDWSDTKVVFFGDSVIANFTDTTSIPGVVHALTNAKVYNCGYGGNSAAYTPDCLINLPGIVDAFLNQDLSAVPTDQQVYQGLCDYFADAAETDHLCFVINYGLNDYFESLPIDSEDPYDIATYSGALRTAVRDLQNAYPTAHILLNTPTYNIYYGQATAEPGAVDSFPDYVEAVKKVGAEQNVPVMDNFTGLGIDYQNISDYMPDGVHPNEAARFRIGQHIALSGIGDF